MGLWDAISSVASSVSNAISTGVDDVEKGVSAVVGEPVHLIQEGCQEAYQGLSKGVSWAADEGCNVLKGAGDWMERAIVGGGGMLLSGIEGIPGDLWDSAKEAVDSFGAFL